MNKQVSIVLIYLVQKNLENFGKNNTDVVKTVILLMGILLQGIITSF
jgi:hypothetical protein